MAPGAFGSPLDPCQHLTGREVMFGGGGVLGHCQGLALALALPKGNYRNRYTDYLVYCQATENDKSLKIVSTLKETQWP